MLGRVGTFNQQFVVATRLFAPADDWELENKCLIAKEATGIGVVSPINMFICLKFCLFLRIPFYSGLISHRALSGEWLVFI